MGCDYYFFLYLKIEHTYGTAYIELSCERGYFCNCLDPGYDSDADNKEEYEGIIEKIKELYLTPSIHPVLIYSNCYYTKPKFQEKYDKLVNYKIDSQQKYWKDIGILQDKDDIISIYKIEIRQKLL
jgi:hypothetical protein